MVRRGLDPRMITNICDIMERRINEKIAQVDAIVDATFSKRVEKPKK